MSVSLQTECNLIDVAPEPVLAGLERADHGVPGGVVVLRRVLETRVVAAAHLAALHALAQMHPLAADLQALGAALGARRLHRHVDLIEGHPNLSQRKRNL